MFPQNDIDKTTQKEGICILFSYFKSVAALHGKPEVYKELMIRCFDHYFPDKKGRLRSTMKDEIIHDCIYKLNKTFEFNYTKIKNEIMNKLHHEYPVTMLENVGPKPQDCLPTLIKKPSLMNLAFNHYFQGSPINFCHSVIVGSDDSHGMYIVDPRFPTAYSFFDIRKKDYIDVRFGEFFIIQKAQV